MAIRQVHLYVYQVSNQFLKRDIQSTETYLHLETEALEDLHLGSRDDILPIPKDFIVESGDFKHESLPYLLLLLLLALSLALAISRDVP